jgi:plasmid stability protein
MKNGEPDPEVQLLLKRRAAANDRSMEAEVRAILSESVRTRPLGQAWVDAVLPHRGTDLELPERSAARELDLS